jgi:hypothetical protein
MRQTGQEWETQELLGRVEDEIQKAHDILGGRAAPTRSDSNLLTARRCIDEMEVLNQRLAAFRGLKKGV